MSAVFAHKELTPLHVDKTTMLTLPGTIQVVDAVHPDRLDWRSVGLAIDLDQGCWQHLLLDQKPGGRSSAELARCPVFSRVAGELLTRLYKAAWPGFKGLAFPGNMPAKEIFSQPETGAGIVSLHAGSSTQTQLRTASHHEQLAIVESWRALAASQAARRAASVP